MNVGVIAASFAVVAPAELPDKTFLAAITISSRHRPLPVFWGVFLGLVVEAAVAVVAGGLIALAPHRVVAGITASGFLAGGAYPRADKGGIGAKGRRVAFLRGGGARFPGRRTCPARVVDVAPRRNDLPRRVPRRDGRSHPDRDRQPVGVHARPARRVHRRGRRVRADRARSAWSSAGRSPGSCRSAWYGRSRPGSSSASVSGQPSQRPESDRDEAAVRTAFLHFAPESHRVPRFARPHRSQA